MKDEGDHYSYIVTYVDDVLYAGRKPEEFMEKMRETFTLKDVSYSGGRYLGGDRGIRKGFRTMGSEIYKGIN